MDRPWECLIQGKVDTDKNQMSKWLLLGAIQIGNYSKILILIKHIWCITILLFVLDSDVCKWYGIWQICDISTLDLNLKSYNR